MSTNLKKHYALSQQALLEALVISSKLIYKGDRRLEGKYSFGKSLDDFYHNETGVAISTVILYSFRGVLTGTSILDVNPIYNVIIAYYEDKVTMEDCFQDIKDYIQSGLKKVYG